MADVELCETTLKFLHNFNDCHIQRLIGKVRSLKLSFGSTDQHYEIEGSGRNRGSNQLYVN